MLCTRRFAASLRKTHQRYNRYYAETHSRSTPGPHPNSGSAFWGEAANQVRWFNKPSVILDESRAPIYKWFPDGEINMCYNALDQHVFETGKADKTAFIYDSPLAGVKRQYTYKEMYTEVNRVAQMLLNQGVKKGDRVLIYMPLVPEAAQAMLACTRIGAIHSVVFAGFAPAEIAKRLDHAKADFLIASSCSLLPGGRVMELKKVVDAALSMCTHKLKKVIVHQREPVEAPLVTDRDCGWSDELAKVAGDAVVPCERLPAGHPCYVLYTSGTTGNPKGLVRETGGHIVSLQYSRNNSFSGDPNMVMCAASDIGWVVGHSYIIYAPLIWGDTSVMYDGKPIGTPDPGAWWRLVNDYNVTDLFFAPTGARAVKKEDPQLAELRKYSVHTLKQMSMAGERCDPDTLLWLRKAFKSYFQTLGLPPPLILDQFWQTESGSPMIASQRHLFPLHNDDDIPVGSAGKGVPGYKFVTLDDDGQYHRGLEKYKPESCLFKGLVENPVRDGTQTYQLAFELPPPPGMSVELYGDSREFKDVYYCPNNRYHKTGDAGFIDKCGKRTVDRLRHVESSTVLNPLQNPLAEDGYIHVLTRVDDVINVAGHRLCTASMEQIVATHPQVAECAVFGVADDLKGQKPFVCVVLKGGTAANSEIEKEVLDLIVQNVGKITCADRCQVVDGLPKTRSGKILRKELCAIVEGRDFKLPPTIEDASVLDKLKAVLRPQL